MIFVTVGTTLPFDELVEAVDALVAEGRLREEVICQIGHGSYVPRNCEWFKFTPQIDTYIEQARLVIGHGGTGTVTGLLRRGKRFIAVANPLGADDHQAEFLDRLSREVPMLWTADLMQLEQLVERASAVRLTFPRLPKLVEDLQDFLCAPRR